jgi:hypothetical protein
MEPQLFFGNEPKRELMNPIENDWQKAKGGLWTSTFENGKSDWVEWCEWENFFTSDSRDGWLLIPNKAVKLITIDSYKDLENLYKNFGIELHQGYEILDFKKMANTFDGIHLTHKGRTETRLSAPYNFNSWDVESTNWFRWCFDEVKYMGKIEIEEHSY